MAKKIKHWVLFFTLFFIGRYICEFIEDKTWVYFTGFMAGWIIMTLTSLVDRSRLRKVLDSVDRLFDRQACPRKREIKES